MNEQPPDLRDQIGDAIRDEATRRTIPPAWPAGPGGSGASKEELADAVLAVVQPKLDNLAEQLAEMTGLRDNALRAAAHADQSIHIDLEGILADGLHGRWDWDGDDHAPEDLVRAIVGIVRPVVAHAVKRADEAEGAASRSRYRQLDVIAQHDGHRRWQVIAVEPTTYLVHSLFGAAEPSFNRWPHAQAEAATALEHSQARDRIGTICQFGRAFMPPATCPGNHTPGRTTVRETSDPPIE